MPHVPTAYLLVTHGSRDPRSTWAAQRLAEQVRHHLARVGQHSLWIETATLELAEVPLHQRLQQMGDRLQQMGGGRVRVVPLFLLPGVHVMDDIPAEVAQARLPGIEVEVLPYLGQHPQMAQILRRSRPDQPGETRILLAHGSRRPGGNAPIEAIAAQMDAVPAYWSVSPSLADQVELLVRDGASAIAILPYVLFAGGITDAVAQQVAGWQQHYPSIAWHLGAPLADLEAIAAMVVDGLHLADLVSAH
jgi:sirohydrochlorin cobaltochelatase